MKAAETRTRRLVVLTVVAGLTNPALAATFHISTPTLVWFIAGIAIGIVFHEAGHALCAIITGLPIRRAVAGAGPLLWRHRMGIAQLELRLLPIGGAVYLVPPFPPRKLPMVLVLLGGILGNLALVGIVSILDAIGAVPSEARAPLTTIVATQFLLVAISLVPYRTKGGLGSDGLQLLELLLEPFWPRLAERRLARAYAGQISRYADPATAQSSWSAASLRIAHQMNRLDGWSDHAARREIQQALVSELALGGLQREEEMLALDLLLTYALASGDAGLRPHLDEWSLRALELGPELQTLVATRGGVLVELGHYEAGRALLLPLLTVQGNQAQTIFDRLMTQYFLARAEHALGNVAAAQACATAARQTAASIWEIPAAQVLMERIDAELR